MDTPRYYLVRPLDVADYPDADWLVAAPDVHTAARACRIHYCGEALPDVVTPPDRFLVRAMLDPADWGVEPFSVPGDSKYEAEAFRALWGNAVHVDLRTGG